MTRSKLWAVALIPAMLVMIISAAAVSASWEGVEINPHAESACHREVRKKSPQGHRDLETFSYALDGAKVGVASGAFKTEFRQGRWTPIGWTCRVRTDNKRVIRVEFSMPRGKSRLLAVAKHATS